MFARVKYSLLHDIFLCCVILLCVYVYDSGRIMSHNIIVMTIEDLLSTWNLQQYASVFQSNGIEIDELQTLLEPAWKDVLDSLIPIPGHRMRFIKNLKTLIEESISENNSDLNKLSSNDRKEIIIPLSPKPSTSSVPLENIQEIPKNICSKKRSRKSDEPNVTRGEQLRLHLSKSATGRCILQLAKQGPCLKQDKDRNKLTEIIIENELAKSEKISNEGFTELVGAIQHIFPEEDSEFYFIPYKYSNGRKFLAKGKLITKYYSIRKEFKALGIITKNKDQLDSDSEDDLEVDDGLQGKLNFLEENIEPWSAIVEYWKDTSKHRIAKLHVKSKCRVPNRNKDKGNVNIKNKFKDKITLKTTQEVANISTYTNKYPALKEKLGYTLFEIDFDLLYPEQKIKAYNSYQDFCDRIIEALKNEESKCEAVKDNLLFLTSDDISEDIKNLVALLSLCYLDTVVTVARRSGNGNRNRTWRPPHAEIQEGVISHIESIGKLQTFMQERKKKLINWGITVQPYVLVCGSSVNNIDACYVILDTETQFLVQSPVRALDLCFKIIHAAHLEYSPESYRLWRLIQKELYELTTEFDEWKSDAQLPKLFKKFPRK